MWRTLHNKWLAWAGTHAQGLIQSTSAQAFNLLGLIAGSILASSVGVLNQFPWGMLVFPGLLSVRGAIGGLFSGRLSTGLHLGTIQPRLHNNTAEAYQLFSSIIVLTALSATLLSLGGVIFQVLVEGNGLPESLEIIQAVYTSMALSLATITPITFTVSILSFERGWDPDVVVYAITSTSADILISLIFVSVMRSLLQGGWGVAFLRWMVTLGFIGLAIWLHLENRGKPGYSKTLKEARGTLVVVSTIVTFTGLTLGRLSQAIGNAPEVYTIYPAIISNVGDAGSMIGSTATTKLNLGLLEARLESFKGHLREVGYAWASSLIMFTLYSLVSCALYGWANLPRLLATVWLTNILIIPLIALLSFSAGIYTFQRGLDPDNFVIPFETSLADGLTTLILYLILSALY